MEKSNLLKRAGENYRRLNLNDLEWNLDTNKKDLQNLLSSGGAELSTVTEIEDIIKNIEKELLYRSQNN